ncbi:MAG: hypothetical protein EZS26_004066 [Candidatus Ordinivivax streblomastigis]|uniref:Helix-turn-helix domain-containing protein n=1 Tax=Candidatus Ordinivivax streblomastigis TaxID=2540710 RepID=A0A5M8NS05_9BACT|nr:MAG: hypothetical protein EZS26_004066 [Candidatus Ordinivivax streblomastigis]
MSNEIITKDDERIKSFFRSLDRMFDKIDRLVANTRPTLNGESFLTDREVSGRLKVSKRTLQDYRTEGKIHYIHLGGKILYRESDVQKMLDKNYRSSFE